MGDRDTILELGPPWSALMAAFMEVPEVDLGVRRIKFPIAEKPVHGHPN